MDNIQLTGETFTFPNNSTQSFLSLANERENSRNVYKPFSSIERWFGPVSNFQFHHPFLVLFLKKEDINIELLSVHPNGLLRCDQVNIRNGKYLDD